MTALTPRSTDYASWYHELVRKADLAEPSDVRGSMIIKPYGFSLWEEIKGLLDQQIKATGHQNAYFPLFIPAGYLGLEGAHIKVFAKECAVVTHYRLKQGPGGPGDLIPDPEAKLQEPLVVRPTSETIIWNSFRKWIQSYRDLPLLINQWANVVRWEMRTHPFLRTAEILWQEGHTAHATAAEAQAEAAKMLEVYTNVVRNELAIPVIIGEKTENERFAGADTTYTMEALMQDGKALQLGTSHFLGQNFSKAFEVKFAGQDGTLDYAWGTSWGVTTRLIGALVMTHGDDKGLVVPPRVAPVQVVVLPVFLKDCDKEALRQYASEVHAQLHRLGVRTKLDLEDTHHPGWKFSEYECKGVPIRLVVGPRDMAARQVELVRRDQAGKQSLPFESLAETLPRLLTEIQTNLYQKALHFQQAHTTHVKTYEEFKQVMQTKRGFVMAHWDGTTATEQQIKEETKATIRCIPLSETPRPGKCIYSGKPSRQQVLFAQAY